MAIFYTSHEGGIIQKFPKPVAHYKAWQQLDENISTHKYQRDEITTDIFDDVECPLEMKCSYLCGIRVHSVFFTLGTDLYFIWDSNSNLYGHQRWSSGMKNYPEYFGAVKHEFKDFIKNKRWLNSSQ